MERSIDRAASATHRSNRNLTRTRLASACVRVRACVLLIRFHVEIYPHALRGALTMQFLKLVSRVSHYRVPRRVQRSRPTRHFFSSYILLALENTGLDAREMQRGEREREERTKLLEKAADGARGSTKSLAPRWEGRAKRRLAGFRESGGKRTMRKRERERDFGLGSEA